MSDDDTSLRNFEENKYLTLAFEKLQKHPTTIYLRSLHVAILVRGGRILSIGYNKSKKNRFATFYKRHPGSAIHAEMDAILKVRKKIDLTDCKLYVARLMRIDGTLGNSKPCEMCQKILKKYGIKRVYYTIEPNKYDMMRIN